MSYAVDLGEGQNPHVDCEPSIIGGLQEGTYPTHDQGPVIEGRLTRTRIARTDDYQQAGERYLLSEQWARDDPVANLVALGQCDRPIRERMGWHLLMCEDELGRRVGDGPQIAADDVRHLEPLQTQDLTEGEQDRRANLGKIGPRDVVGKVMTHCVRNERVAAGR